MNPEIHKIIENMKHPSEFLQTADTRQNYLSVQMAQLLVLLAEETERQSNKIADQTEKMIYWTKAIVALTIALFFLGAIQIGVTIYMILKS